MPIVDGEPYLTKGDFKIRILESPDNINAFDTWMASNVNSSDPLMKAGYSVYMDSNGITLTSPFVQQFIPALINNFVITADCEVRLQDEIEAMLTASSSTSPIVYDVTVKAMDEITADNIWGLKFRGSYWEVRIDILNKTTGVVYNEVAAFAQIEQPTDSQISSKINEIISRIRNM